MKLTFHPPITQGHPPSSPTPLPRLPTYAASDCTSNASLPSSPPLPSHGLPLTPAIIDDSDADFESDFDSDDYEDDPRDPDEHISQFEVTAPQKGIVEGLRDLLGRDGLVESGVARQGEEEDQQGAGERETRRARDREASPHPYELAMRAMDPRDRNPGLHRRTPRPPHEIPDLNPPPLEVLLLLSPFPESEADQLMLCALGEKFVRDYPAFVHVDLYAHYRAAASTVPGPEEIEAREKVRPVDLHSLRLCLGKGRPVSPILGVRVLKRLIDGVVNEGKRSVLVSGLGEDDREAVEMFAREVVRPKAILVFVVSNVSRDDDEYAAWETSWEEYIVAVYRPSAVVVLSGGGAEAPYAAMQAAMFKRAIGWQPKAMVEA